MSGGVDMARERIAAWNRALVAAGRGGDVVSMAQARLQLGWIGLRGRPWKGAPESLALCERAGWAYCDREQAELTEDGAAVLAALDAAAKAARGAGAGGRAAA